MLTRAFNGGIVFGVKIHLNWILFAIFATQSGSKPAAVVNGEVITEEQVAKAAAGDLQKLEARMPQGEARYEQEKLQIMHKALDSMLEDKLLGFLTQAHEKTTVPEMAEV